MDKSQKSKTEQKKFEKDIEKTIEDNFTRRIEAFFKRRGFGYFLEGVLGAVFASVFLIVFLYFYDDITFISKDFEQVKSLYIFSIVLSIFFSIFRAFFRNQAAKTIAETINFLVLIIVAYQFWTVFPFDTSVIGDQQTWDKIFRSLIIIIPLVNLFGVITNFVKIATGSEQSDS